MEAKLVGTKKSDSSSYNPYIHGTHSSILALLPKTEFTVLSPIEMISRYQVAPITGEITKGGLRDLSSDSKSAFGRLQLSGVNHYTLDKIIRNYATQKSIDLSDKAKLIEDVRLEFQHLFRNSFSNINILLIYLARAKQAGITNRELMSEAQEADIIASMEATIQFHYLILLFGNKFNPNYKWLENLSEEQKKDTLYAISTHLSFHSIVEKMVISPIDLKSIYENPAPSPLEIASVEELLELPKESIISICNDRFNLFYVDKHVTLEKTTIFAAMSAIDAECFLSKEEYSQLRMDDDFPDANKVISHLLNFDYPQNIDNFLRFFAAKKMPQRFFTTLKPLVLNQIQVLQHRLDLLKKLLEKEPSNILDMRYERFITHGFPLILICENDEAMTLINETTMEYRSQDSLRLGENVTMIATDSLENQEIILDYLREHHLTSISVVSFDQLKESKSLGIKPVGLEITASRSSTEFSFAGAYQPCIFKASNTHQGAENAAANKLELR